MTSANAASNPPDEPRLSPRLGRAIAALRLWWRAEAAGTVDQAAVIAKRRSECALTARYLLLITMSAGIAILGLLLSSPAVVIGAMLLSPLMDPIMGVGFALAVGDYRWLRQSARTLLVGVAFAIAFCAAIVLLSPLQTVTSEIAARTRPNLFDLLVAIFSAIAGAYAMIRGREGTIVGVAIATALMPPLAVVGFGIATLNWAVFSGALLLFITNLTAIALTATVMARFYGFSTHLSEKQTRLQALLISGVLVALAIPLGLALVQIGWETQATRQIRAVLADTYDGQARISQLEPDFEAVPIRVSATVLTPEIIPDAERLAARRIARQLGVPVDVTLTQVRVGSGALAAQEAQLANARAREEAAEARARAIAERLALLAGVPEEEVTIDRAQRRALVTARPLDGATLAAYAELERRIDALEPGWDIRLRPPVLALPEVVVAGEGALDDSARTAIGLIAWAQRRIGLPVRLTGPADGVELAAAALAEQGVMVEQSPTGAGFGRIEAAWAVGQ